jgi:hypothetical protein
MYLDEWTSSSWWYPDLKSSFEYTVEPLKSCISSSIVGNICLSWVIALFVLRISTQSIGKYKGAPIKLHIYRVFVRWRET